MPLDRFIGCRRLFLVAVAGTSVITASCSTYHRSDLPAVRQQSPHNHPEQKPHNLKEKNSESLSSHATFEQEGVASSYGSEFHGRPTSNGETYDMHAMTAAHKTLPLGIFVRVRHKRNGNEVIVRINDRGPFARDRIIDLSHAAAEQLAMLKEGVAAVTVSALGYRIEGQTDLNRYRPPPSYDNGSFSLQVGSFTVKANAYRYAGDLKRKHGSADVQEANVGGTKFYRVRLGRYSSLQAAQSGQKSYEQKGFPGCFVVAVD